MMIQLPNDLEGSIQAIVNSGRFAWLVDAMAEAARLLLRDIKHERPKPNATATEAPPDPLLGIWRDAPDELDDIVADAMRHLAEEP